jgi:cell division septum initiation protein DivIVA
MFWALFPLIGLVVWIISQKLDSMHRDITAMVEQNSRIEGRLAQLERQLHEIRSVVRMAADDADKLVRMAERESDPEKDRV